MYSPSRSPLPPPSRPDSSGKDHCNIVLVSTTHQQGSVVGLHTSPRSWATSYSIPPLRFPQSPGLSFPGCAANSDWLPISHVLVYMLLYYSLHLCLDFLDFPPALRLWDASVSAGWHKVLAPELWACLEFSLAESVDNAFLALAHFLFIPTLTLHVCKSVLYVLFFRSDSVFKAGILGGLCGGGETRREESRMYWFWSTILWRGEGSRYGFVGVCVCVCVCVCVHMYVCVCGERQRSKVAGQC